MIAISRGRFGDVIEGPLGLALQAFMQRPDNVVRMETATALDQVAIEPLGPYLLEEFGAAARADRFKQAVGFIARQVLEARGFRVVRSSRISRPGLFTSGTRYASDRAVEQTSDDLPVAQGGPQHAQASSGVNFEELDHIRYKLGLNGITLTLPADFDDPTFSRHVLGLDR